MAILHSLQQQDTVSNQFIITMCSYVPMVCWEPWGILPDVSQLDTYPFEGRLGRQLDGPNGRIPPSCAAGFCSSSHSTPQSDPRA